MSKADQALILVPLLNALRLRMPPEGQSVDPARFAGAAAILLRADPGVAMLAIRNALGRESANRPSGARAGYGVDQGIPTILRLFAVDQAWFEAFARIRNAMDEAGRLS